MLHVPLEVRRLWDKQRTRNRWNDIFEIEAVGPLVLLENYPEALEGSLWLHFVDNAAALSSLINGSSSVCEGDAIIGETWSRIQGLKVYPWWDQVDTSSNPVGNLSRGILSGPWDVALLRFPGSLLPARRRFCRLRGGLSGGSGVPGLSCSWVSLLLLPVGGAAGSSAPSVLGPPRASYFPCQPWKPVF